MLSCNVQSSNKCITGHSRFLIFLGIKGVVQIRTSIYRTDSNTQATGAGDKEHVPAYWLLVMNVIKESDSRTLKKITCRFCPLSSKYAFNFKLAKQSL